jgi:hypothetical protein
LTQVREFMKSIGLQYRKVAAIPGKTAWQSNRMSSGRKRSSRGLRRLGRVCGRCFFGCRALCPRGISRSPMES